MKVQQASLAALALSLQVVPVLSQTTAAPNFVDQLLQGAKSILDSYYPSISSLETLSIPSAVTIDGSVYRIPVIALPTPTDTSSSSSSSSASTGASVTSSGPSTTPPPSQTSADQNTGPTDTPAAQTAHGPGPDRRLGIILGVTLSLLALAVLAAVLFYVRRRKKRTGYFLKHNPPPNDDEVTSWRGENEKPTSSFFVRPLNHSAHIWSEHSPNSRYQPVSTAPDAHHTGKNDSTIWSGAAGIPGGTGAPRATHEDLPNDSSDTTLNNPTSSASPAAPAAAAAVSNPFTNDAHPLRNSATSPLATQEPFTAPTAPTAPAAALTSNPPSSPPHNSHKGRTAAAAGLGALAGAAVARQARKSSSHSRSRSRPRKSSDAIRPAQPLARRTSGSDEYHTPPEDAAADMTVNDGPYARADRASWGDRWRRRSGGDPEKGQGMWRQSRDMSYDGVPDPYAGPVAGAGTAGKWEEHRERRKSWGTTPTPVEEDRRSWGERGRPATPLMHGMFGAGKKEEGLGRAATVGSTASRASTISRKPVPGRIQTQGLDGLPEAKRENPFVSPEEYAEHSPGPYGGRYAKGDYEEDYGPTPLLPQRSPQRRYSPMVHYPSGPEVSQFDFGLTREQLRDLREAGERRSMEGGSRRGAGERTWSFERGS